MHPVICTIGPLTIYSYGLTLVLAFVVGSFLASRQAKKINIDPEVIFNLAFVVFVFGVIGARLFYVIENLKVYLRFPIEIIMLQHGGLSWFGGFILGTTAAVFYLRRKKVKVFVGLDLVAPFLALAQAIGRIGCLLNGCCYGKDSIPTQAYSGVILLLIYITLRFMQDRPHKEGQIFFSYVFLYSIKRFFIEFWRADNPPIFMNLTLFQILCIVAFFISLANLIRIIRSKR